MKLLSKFGRDVTGGNIKNALEQTAKKHYEFVKVYDNFNEYNRYQSYPYRLHIRTDNINNDLIYEYEEMGFECKKGTTCNEWETSMQVRKNAKMKQHPPHMEVTVKSPAELQVMAPRWSKFLKEVKFLGHLLGTLDNGIEVHKQAFGECDTSIVLETFKRAYGEDYKSHQCSKCINCELDFKQSIVEHNIQQFEEQLQLFVTHFLTTHNDLYERLKNTPEDYLDDNNEVSYDGKRSHPKGYLDD